MKIGEIITEVKAGHVPKNYKQSSSGLHIFSDGEKSNTDYTHMRLGLALACADGKGNVADIDPKTFYGKKHTAHPYTPEEADMLKQSYKLVGANYKDLNQGNLNSLELKDTHKVSPVPNPGPIKRRSK
jgi:hypothetical protein